MEIVLLPSKVFEAAVVDTTILRVQRTVSPPREYAFKVKKFQKTDRPIFDPSNLGEMEELPNSSLRLDSFNVVADSRSAPIIGKIEQSSTRVSDIADVFYGIKAYQVGKGKPPQTRAIVETKPFTSDTRRGNDWLPFYDGKDITRYRVLWQQNNWIRYGQWLAEPRNPRKFEGKKVLIRKIVGERLFATYVAKTSYCNTLLFVLKLKPESRFTYPTVLGIANSRLIGWYIRQRLQISEDDTFPQIMVGDIEALPIPNGHCGEHAKLDSLVTRMLASGEANAIDDIPALEAAIDRIVYSLYNLTPDEIAIVEGLEPGAKKAPVATKPAKAVAGAKKARKSVLTDDPDLA